ncbi:hypothetical protein D5281_17935 [bacterium 1xD42-62]|uniref:Uncharacterized protein n=1 Tax=Parablautia muri TaxID=2320879 RepID=A0A9X5BIS9_9FIRM|nr:hypothetical protein [Parablautia muri]
MELYKEFAVDYLLARKFIYHFSDGTKINVEFTEYGSILLDDGLAESLIVSQIGHTNIKTTKEHYYKNRRNADQIMSESDKVIAL